jgi:hypothetical protein
MRWIPPVLAAVLIAVIAVPNLYTAVQRSHQKLTMADMRDAAARHEQGQPIGALTDAWGHPMQVRIREGHYSIRAAMRDGKFQYIPLGKITSSWDADVVLVDGTFQQMPEGI